MCILTNVYFAFFIFYFYIALLKDPVEAIGFGRNATVPQEGHVTLSCPVDGNPKPNVSWYRGSEVSGKPISREDKLQARESECYTCAASNSLGKQISITQCLKDGKHWKHFS